MNKKILAILGSNSHIAKGLIVNFLKNGEYMLHLYTHLPEKLRAFFNIIDIETAEKCIVHDGYKDFAERRHDTIINCVGVGTLNKIKRDYSRYFTVTEEYDNLALGYLCNYCPDVLYISLSSGAVYGGGFSAPVDENTVNNIRVNHVRPEDYYAITRLNAEAKHRSFKKLKIVDLRVFSYFSRFIDLSDGYFITEIIDCILNKKVFVTNKANIVRDYIHPKDLFSIILKCMNAGEVNDAFDIKSSKPVEKKEILKYFSTKYGLRYEIKQSYNHVSATGAKNIYCSNYNNATGIGFKPIFSSMDTIEDESEYILNGCR